MSPKALLSLLTGLSPLTLAIAFIAYQNLATVPFLLAVPTIPSLQQKLTTSTTTNSSASQQLADLRQIVDEQNQQITNLQQLRQRDFQIKTNLFNQITKQSNDQRQLILTTASVIPTTDPVNECQASMEFLNHLATTNVFE